MALNGVRSVTRLWNVVYMDFCRLQLTCRPCFFYASKYSTDVAVSSDEDQLSENDKVTKNFVNRNPRNLERMAIQWKDRGWKMSHPRKDYWHKLYLKKSARHISAHVEHMNGNIVLMASSKEWAIKKHLHSCGDVMAAYNVGKVLAQRCLEAGIGYVHWNVVPVLVNNEKTRMFVEAMKEGGVILNEPKDICDYRKPIEYFPDIDHDPDPVRIRINKKEARRKRLSLDF